MAYILSCFVSPIRPRLIEKSTNCNLRSSDNNVVRRLISSHLRYFIKNLKRSLNYFFQSDLI